MNYLKVYNALIEKRKSVPPKEDFERHHIKPKSLFPELAKDKNNLVKLTYREHYLAHHLLYRYFKSIGDKNASLKMACAWMRMCKNKDGLRVSINDFEKAKKYCKQEKRQVKISEETRKKLSIAGKGRHHTIESIQKIIDKQKGRKFTEEHKNKISTSLKGKTPWMKGRHHTIESIQKNSLAHLGKESWNKNIPCKEETKEKLRKSSMCKKVICVELNLIFTSIQEASKIMKINRGNIGTCCRKVEENLKAGGFHWKFI